MKQSKFSEHQIKEVEKGMPVADICRRHGISSSTYFKWKAKYGGMEASDIRRLKELESENDKLKQMYAELSLERHALRDLIEKNSDGRCQARLGRVPDKDTRPERAPIVRRRESDAKRFQIQSEATSEIVVLM